MKALQKRKNTKRPASAKRHERLASRTTRTVVAERQEALTRRVDLDRGARYADYISKIKPRAGVRARAAAVPLAILAEGDSWFEYPLDTGGIIDHLQDLIEVPVCNMAHHGDEVRQIMGLSQRKEMIKRLSDKRVRFDALLFSGGGNDLVGDQFCIWLKDFKPGDGPEQLINGTRLEAVLATVEAGYRDLVSLRDSLSPQTKLFFHGYDFPPVTGKKACFVGPWLKPSLEFRGINDGGVQNGVVKIMLSRFADMLKKLAQDSPNVFYIDTQNTLAPDKTWWANEIHPSPKGFKKMAEKFKAALEGQFPQLSQ